MIPRGPNVQPCVGTSNIECVLQQEPETRICSVNLTDKVLGINDTLRAGKIAFPAIGEMRQLS